MAEEQIPLVVDGDWLEARLDDPQLRLFDTTVHLTLPVGGGYYSLESGRETYEQRQIRGAAYADLLGDLSDPDDERAFTAPTSERFAERAGALGIGDDTYVVVYDQYDPSLDPAQKFQHWAARFWWQLRLEGFDRVAILNGGLLPWIREGRPTTENQPRTYPPATFTPRHRAATVAVRDEVLAAIDDEHTALVHTVDPKTHRGETLTHERPGRIPGSVNLYYEDLFDPGTGKLRSDAELRAEFEARGLLRPGQRAVTYCGSGCAASLGALMLRKLGQHEVAVYDGSMTEWAADDALPMETDASVAAKSDS